MMPATTGTPIAQPTKGAGKAWDDVAPRFDAPTRLAERVLNGEVVFFVGSGFSIDSEGNSTFRLVGRLLAGLLAMGTVLDEETDGKKGQARALLVGLGQVFRLENAVRPTDAPLEPARCMTEANVNLLAREYYNFNEWSVSALSVLSRELLDLEESRRDGVVDRIERLGSYLLSLIGETVPFDAIDWRAREAFASEAARGKSLFLDIMGFANQEVMAGTPQEADIEKVVRSYQDRLRPRHHALARLAREGLAPILVTTNYDLLLEGAYRLAGFLDRESSAIPEDTPLTAMPRYSCIAGADQFFARGEGHRTALLLKIHGSAGVYREVRSTRLEALKQALKDGSKASIPADPWAGYLPAMVFTYREIQTWRADAWSRDLIRTLLRTHTLALCGYSGADPIMHSTFREVYEERAGTVPRRIPDFEPDDARKAPVFFFGIAARREFYSLEILRAATDATGHRARKLVDHPNQIEFERGSGFPNIDDHFSWIVHCVIREQQREALKTRLRRLAARLLGHPCPDADVTALNDRFQQLCDAEKTTIAELGGPASGESTGLREQRFDRIVGWTWHFVPGLLRELALAEMVESRQGPGGAVRINRSFPWYQPVSERPEWAAWAAIVEMALRSMVAAWRRDKTGGLLADSSWLAAEESPHAAISFARGESERQPLSLCIRLAGFERPGRPPALTGAFRQVTFWEFSERDVPWPIKPTTPCPKAGALWRWAAGQRVTARNAALHLGVGP